MFELHYSFKKISLTADPNNEQYKQLPYIISFSCDELNLKGISLYEVLVSKKVNLTEINTKQNVTIDIFLNDAAPTKDSLKKKSEKQLDFFRIAKIDLPSINFSVHSLKNKKNLIESKSVSIKGFSLESDLQAYNAFSLLSLKALDTKIAGNKFEQTIKFVEVNLSEKLVIIGIDSAENNSIISRINAATTQKYSYTIKAKKIALKANNLFAVFNSLSDEQESSNQIQQIILIEPEIIIERKFRNTLVKNKNSAIDSLSGLNIGIKSIRIENGLITYKDSINKFEINLNKFNIEMYNLSLAKNDEELPFTFNNLSFDAQQLDCKIGKFDYKIIAKKIKYNNTQKQLTINNICALYGKNSKALLKQKGSAVSLVSILDGSITMKDPILKNLDKSILISASSIEMKGAKITVEKDKTFDWDVSRKYELPQETIKKLGFKINIDSIRINQSTIVYKEYNSFNKLAGIINLSKCNLTANNLSNINFTKNTSVRFTAIINDQLPFSAGVSASLLNKQNEHTVNCSFGKGDLTCLNSYLEPAQGIKIISGNIHQINSTFNCTNKYSLGWVIPEYSNLKIEFKSFDKIETAINKKNEKEGNEKTTLFNKNVKLKAKVANILANSALVTNNNLANGEIKKGIINYNRLDHRPFINFWTMSLMDGLTEVLVPATKQLEKRKGK